MPFKEGLAMIYRFILVLSIFICCQSLYAKGKNLKIAWLEWPPLGGASLKLNGIVPDILRTVFYEAGYTVEFKFYPWLRHLHLVENHDADLSAGVWESPNLADRFEFLQNIAIDPGTFVTLKSSPIKSGKLSSLNNKRVGVIVGGGYPDSLTKNKSLALEKSSDIVALLTMLEKKRIDAIYNQPHTINWLVDTKYTSLKGKIKVLDPPLVINLLSPAISKKHPNKKTIMADFQRSFKKLVKDGLYEKMYKKFQIKLNPQL